MNATRSIAPDTNLLADKTSRRMLLGVAHETSHAVVVLPEVFAEVRRRIAALTRAGWIDRLERDGRFTDGQKQMMVDGAATAAVTVFEAEVEESDNDALKALHPSRGQAWAAHRTARNLPPNVVRSTGTGSLEGDPLALAQAAVFDVPLLSTNNLETIWHRHANAWAASTFGRRTPLVYTPDEALVHLSNDSARLRYEWSLAYAMRLPAKATDELPMRDRYEDGLRRLYGAGFTQVADESRWQYEADPDFDASLRAAAGRRGVEPSARAERACPSNAPSSISASTRS